MNIEKLLLRKTSQAIKKYSLLHQDEKVVFAISGGKDSKSLLKILVKLHPKECIFPMHVFPYIEKDIMKDIQDFCCELLNRDNALIVVENSDWKKTPEDCYRCSRSRKKVLFETAVDMGIKKIVYAHNKNDVAETFLMNVIFSGNTYTMFPEQSFFDDTIRVIRPFYNIEIRDIIRYCRIYHISPVAYECRGKTVNKRDTIRKILSSLDENTGGKSNSVVHRIFTSSKKANRIK